MHYYMDGTLVAYQLVAEWMRQVSPVHRFLAVVDAKPSRELQPAPCPIADGCHQAHPCTYTGSAGSVLQKPLPGVAAQWPVCDPMPLSWL